MVGTEGAQQSLPAVRAELTEDQAAALASVREVPRRIAPDGKREAA